MGNGPSEPQGNNVAAKPLAPLFEAVRAGSVSRVTTELTKGARVDLRDAGGRCPIHYAVEVADSGPALVDLLVARGASPGVEDSFGRTPVHLAATTKNVGVLRALLAQGSRELLLARDVNGMTALHFAVRNKQEDMVDEILRIARGEPIVPPAATTPAAASTPAATPAAAGDTAGTPRILSVADWGGDAAEIVAKAAADLDAAAPATDSAPAAADSAPAAAPAPVSELLEQVVNAADKDGFTALHWAAFHGHLGLGTKLVDAGANRLAMSRSKRSPGELALEVGHEDVGLALLVS